MSILAYLDDEQNPIKYTKDRCKKFDINHKEIEFRNLVFSPFVQLKCMNCGMFRRNYHCLAKPTWKKARDILSKYDRYLLLYIRMDNRPRLKDYREKRRKLVDSGEKNVFNDYILKKNACNANQVQIYHRMRRFLVMIKSRFRDVSKSKLRMFGAGGGCRACRKCGLVMPHFDKPREPCRKPNESFGAPESWGIDVYGTLDVVDLKYQVIPVEDLICVGLIVTKEDG
jgi:predicted metal-binding protein